jgi:hypothetical protein
VLRDLMPLFLFLVSAAVVYAVRERRRRLYTVKPPAPDITLGEVWESLPEALPAHPDRAILPQAGLEAAAGEVGTRVSALEGALGASDDPRAALRAAIVESATRALHFTILSRLSEADKPVLLGGYQPGMEGLVENAAAVCWLECALLRRYAQLRHDDAVPGDWFHHFLSHARPYVKEKVRLARECLIERNQGAAASAGHYDVLLAELAGDAMRAAPKRRFVPPDYPEMTG